MKLAYSLIIFSHKHNIFKNLTYKVSILFLWLYYIYRTNIALINFALLLMRHIFKTFSTMANFRLYPQPVQIHFMLFTDEATCNHTELVKKFFLVIMTLKILLFPHC